MDANKTLCYERFKIEISYQQNIPFSTDKVPDFRYLLKELNTINL